jgi:methylenetetrahydrofolate--tRNA-(uracil-5-)-methyltransferase
LIRVERGEVPALPEPQPGSPVIVATGPLTSSALSASIATFVGREHLAFFDAISPIVLAETIDMAKVFRASRWDRSLTSENADGDYLNCPFTKDEYVAFHAAIVAAEKAEVHDFDRTKFFEGCLPIEVMAHRGVDTLRFGPMKPVGLVDPKTGGRPYAAVQLRQDNIAGDHYSLVGFQTQLKWGEQERVLRLIPGLEHAEFVRLGSLHRNTFINSPKALMPTLQACRRPSLLIAGQVVGVEGYVESAATGLLAGINAARLAGGRELVVPPAETSLGSLLAYVTDRARTDFQPMNANYGLMPPLAGRVRGRERKEAQAARADLCWQDWLAASGIASAAPTGEAATDRGVPANESDCDDTACAAGALRSISTTAAT